MWIVIGRDSGYSQFCSGLGGVGGSAKKKKKVRGERPLVGQVKWRRERERERERERKRERERERERERLTTHSPTSQTCGVSHNFFRFLEHHSSLHPSKLTLAFCSAISLYARTDITDVPSRKKNEGFMVSLFLAEFCEERKAQYLAETTHGKNV